MLGYLWIFNHLQTSTLYQISNSLKTENSLTVLPRLLSVFRTESRRRRSSAKKKWRIPVCCQKLAKKCQCINVEKKSWTQYSEPHLDSHSCFPNLRLSNFMISSLASVQIFVQCPPQKNVHNWAAPTLPCYCSHSGGRPHHALPIAPGWLAGHQACLLKRKSIQLQSCIYGPRSEPIDHQPCLWSR